MKFLSLFLTALISTAALAKPLKFSTENISGKIKLLIDMDQVSGPVDILFIIDNSASMQAHQQTVIANADMFIDGLSKGGTDWKIGLISTTTTDKPYVGMLPGDELTSATPNGAAFFKAAVRKLGMDGDVYEKPFDSITTALTNSPNFLRPNADLAIILVSDAAEQSIATTAVFLKTLSTFKADLSKVSFNGFLNPVDWCTPTDDVFNWQGSKYQELLVTLKGGASGLCDPQFGAKLAVLGDSLSKSSQNPVRTTFHEITLPSIPDFASIEVNYGTQVVSKGSISFGWIYDDAKNQILLGDKIPWTIQPANTPLEVIYVPKDWVK
ncbi:MAG: hypothetical protein ACXVA9_08075 [Bdellovibrionales bacterium]